MGLILPQGNLYRDKVAVAGRPLGGNTAGLLLGALLVDSGESAAVAISVYC